MGRGNCGPVGLGQSSCASSQSSRVGQVGAAGTSLHPSQTSGTQRLPSQRYPLTTPRQEATPPNCRGAEGSQLVVQETAWIASSAVSTRTGGSVVTGASAHVLILPRASQDNPWRHFGPIAASRHVDSSRSHLRWGQITWRTGCPAALVRDDRSTAARITCDSELAWTSL